MDFIFNCEVKAIAFHLFSILKPMENLNYKFQKDKAQKFKKLLNDQIHTFCKRISICEQCEHLSTSDKRLIYVFGYENIMNIIWYRKHIKRETFWRTIYFFISIILLLAIPFLIWFITFHYAPQIENLETGEIIIGVISIILTSIMATHKFITSWLEKRKYLSQFYLAFTELKNILFRLENDYKNGQAIETNSNSLSEEFKHALNIAIVESRRLVTEETKQYFETLSYPNTDFTNLLINPASTLVKNFKSGRLDIEKMKAEKEVSENEIKAILQEIQHTETELNIKKEQVTALKIEKDRKSKLLSKDVATTQSVLSKQEIEQITQDYKAILAKLSNLQSNIIEKESELKVKKTMAKQFL
jgi:hypothetical protein